MTDIATIGPSSGTLALRSDQADWTEQQRAALAQIGVDKARPGDLAVFMHVAQRTGLDPFSRQIYMIERGGKQTIQTGIDGFRVIAQRRPEYAGQTEPQWCGDDGVWRGLWVGSTPPVAARVGVHRHDWKAPAWGVAMFSEFTAGNSMWKGKPAHMLAKCFDTATEVLTEHGYRRFAEVDDARIMQVTAGGLEAVAARPFVQDYDGLMVTLDSDDLNFSVTPNHDMVTTVGKVEAGAMYATSRSRPLWHIPRLAPVDDRPGLNVAPDVIRLAAAILADGSRRGGGWTIEVSRPAKRAALDALGLYEDRYVRGSRGDEATSRRSGRVVRSNFDKQGYRYPIALVADILDERKRLRTDAVLRLNTKQARVLVDTLIEFDGHERPNGVRHFYTSSAETAGAFELAATIAGYAVSPRYERASDLSDRPNWRIGISERDAITFRRVQDGRTGIQLTPNTSGRVWCLTVPSGRIMVRRNGFAMVCGNCAEALALRKAFPHDLAGIMTPEESDRDDLPRGRRGRVIDAEPVTAHELTGGTPVPAGSDADARMTSDQQKKLFACIRDAGIEDRNEWASQLLGRDITSFGQLSIADASHLIDAVERGIAALGDDQGAQQ
ncbi:MAG: recombinase RecT [Pseudonocardia sp.]|nr:recombinase RecT [Pseudonocardia sp.]